MAIRNDLPKRMCAESDSSSSPTEIGIREERELIAHILDGNSEAFAEIVQQYKPRVFGLLSRYEQNQQTLEDLAQEVFLRIWRGLPKFDPDRAPLEHWISRIASNLARDHLRKRKRTLGAVSFEDLGPNALEWLRGSEDDGTLSQLEAEEILQKAMQCLSPEEHIAVTMAGIDGYTAKEIGELTGWSTTAIRVRIHRAKAKLRKSIRKLQ